MTNQNGIASTLSIYGINLPTPTTDPSVTPSVPPAGSSLFYGTLYAPRTPRTSQAVTLAGSSRFYGTVYAPDADLNLGGGGAANGPFVGSLVGKTAFMNGNTHIHYDEALAETGIITRFGLASWFEDTKKF
jgi:hypothetical protein